MKYLNQIVEELANKANNTYTPKQLMDIKQAITEVALAALHDSDVAKECYHIARNPSEILAKS